MEGNHASIVSGLKRLIDTQVPPDTSEKAKQKLLAYSERILGSRLQSTNFSDPSHVKGLITKKLTSNKKPRFGTQNSDAFKLDELYERLK